MLSNLVNLSMQYYADPSRNRPLDGGKIFVGEVDKDPENFPIDVFYIEENGDEVLAAQPIIIGAGGIVMYNGKPVQIGTESAYSIRVRDSDDAQVYYIPDSAAADSSSQFIDMDPVFEMTLEEAVESTQIIEGLLLVISDRDLGYFQVVATSSVVPNGLDVIQCVGNPALSLELRLTGIVSALAAGALLDWNGTTGTDDTLALQNLHSKLVSYTLRGRYALISAPLVMKSDQIVDARGGGIHTTSTDVLFTTNNTKTINFTLERGSFTAENDADFAIISGADSSNQTRNVSFNQCIASGFGTCFKFQHATECIFSGGSYVCKIGISLQSLSSLISFSNSRFDRGTDEIDGTIALIATESNDILFDNVHFNKFEQSINLHSTDVISFRNSTFIGEQQIGGVGGSLDSVIANSRGTIIKNCTFYYVGLSHTSFGANVAFNTKVTNCSFLKTPKDGIDVEIGVGCSSITMSNNYHSIASGITADEDKTGYLMKGANDSISIDRPVFLGYGVYANFKLSGNNNTISNITNKDELEIPIIIDYPVNVYNVEGFNNSYYKEIIRRTATNVKGYVIFDFDNVSLSAGNLTLTLRITTSGSVENGSALDLLIFDAGTGTASSTVHSNQQRTSIATQLKDAKQDLYIFELSALKATACRFKLVTESSRNDNLYWGGNFLGYESSMSVVQR